MEDPLPKLLVLGFLLLALNLQVGSKMEHTERTVAVSAIVAQTEIIAQAPHFVDHYSVLAIVDCMEEEESGCNPDAINWDDWHVSLDGVWIQGSKGCLQFSPYTFSEYCVDKYKLKNDIFDCSVQRECAINMLNENKGHHWSTFNQCT